MGAECGPVPERRNLRRGIHRDGVLADSMEEYSIVGRVIGHDHAPVADLVVEVRRPTELRRTEEVVGETRTGPDGRFELVLDRRKAGGMLARLGESVPIRIVLRDAQRREIMITRPIPIDWQLEYRFFLGGGKKEPGTPDPYSASMHRMIAGTRAAGMGDRMRNGASEPKSRTGWMKENLFAEPSEESGSSVNMLFAVTDGGVAGSVDAPRLRLVEYDGPQVPRQSWDAPDDQVVIWPRRERFRWG
jgi:hypothetical protein